MEAPGRPVLVLSFAGSRVVVSSSRLEESGLMGLRTGHRWSTLTGVSSKPSRQSDEARCLLYCWHIETAGVPLRTVTGQDGLIDSPDSEEMESSKLRTDGNPSPTGLGRPNVSERVYSVAARAQEVDRTLPLSWGMHVAREYKSRDRQEAHV